ncbi:hypothetical protein ILUMI_04345 [Ignelater luminosus]|uniref:DUF4802 domain-containing protein n=1 Tax=Ignelater luminosus TaxID=2038154 RepID=A0A8K0GHF9_IGNLU|nr:hypothetical protein ILUMI_04345 [Ignelater luminosus]
MEYKQYADLHFLILSFLQFFIQNKTEKTGVQEHKVLENNQESNKCTSSRNNKTDSSRTRRSSIDLYEEAAAILGLTCSQTDSCRCIECQSDRTIVTTTIELAKYVNKKVVVVSEATDIAVLVVALTPSNLELYVLKPSRSMKQEELYSSKSLDHLDKCVAENTLFLHAITDCDTVSATY